MNPISIMAQAEKLGIPELQRSIQSGTVPAFIGVPLLQEKVKRQKQMQMGMAAQQPKRPSVAEQVGQEAQQATIADIMRDQALRMQGEMGQTGGISDSLSKPEGYAKGGPIAFDAGGSVSERLKYIREHGLAGTVGGAYKQAYGWSSDLANAIANPDTYQNAYGDLKNEYGELDAATKKILWGVPDEQQSPVPASLNAGVPASDIAKDLIRPTTLPQGAQAMADRIAMGRTSPAPTASFDFANPNQVATDVLDNPARANTDPDLWKWATDYRSQHPQQRRSAPAPTQTPYAQAAAPATQTQPAQEEERDLTLAEYMKQLRDATGENKGIDALRGRLSEREARLAKEEELAPWMASMQAGIAMMAGTSSNALTNIAQGMQTGLQTLNHSMNKLEDAKDKSLDIQAKLEEAQRNEQLAAAKYGVESVQADKKAKATAKLEREKMAHDFKIHEMDNAARLQIENIQAGASRYAVDARADMYGGAGAGKPVKLTDQQRYYNNVVAAMAADPNYMPELRLPNGQPDPVKMEIMRKKTYANQQNEALFGGMGMGSGMMPTQPVVANTGRVPGYTLLSQQ